VIDDGMTGHVVPFGDFAALSSRIIALDQNRALLTRMSRAALEASTRYDPANLAERWAGLVASMS